MFIRPRADPGMSKHVLQVSQIYKEEKIIIIDLNISQQRNHLDQNFAPHNYFRRYTCSLVENNNGLSTHILTNFCR